MDSGNSGGSLQSSSGGGGGIADHPPPLFHPTPILEPPSNFFNPSSFPQPQNQNPNPNSIYDLDSLWSGNPNPIHNVNPSPVDNNTEKLGLFTKNPKKRTRASRRAPTTVLTTDTTNFRQMVQEFTGIPASPFATSASTSAHYSRRLDLYSGLAPMQQQQQPLKPSAQKIQQQSSCLNSNYFQLAPSESYGVTKQPLNLSNLQNQMFPFQSVTQSTLLQQVDVREGENGLIGSSSTGLKRWRGENENLVNFERSGNCENVVVSMRNEGDGQLQLPGNDDSWVCRSD